MWKQQTYLDVRVIPPCSSSVGILNISAVTCLGPALSVSQWVRDTNEDRGIGCLSSLSDWESFEGQAWFLGLQRHVTKSSGWFPVCLHARSNRPWVQTDVTPEEKPAAG